jgi:ABC-type multidrug transport system permease subunit
MQDIYTYIPETNHVPKEYNVAAILFMVPISLAPALVVVIIISIIIIIVIVIIIIIITTTTTTIIIIKVQYAVYEDFSPSFSY